MPTRNRSVCFVYYYSDSKFHVQRFVITILVFSCVYGFLYYKLFSWKNLVPEFQVQVLSSQAHEQLKLTEIAKQEMQSQINPVRNAQQQGGSTKTNSQFLPAKPFRTISQILTGQLTNPRVNPNDVAADNISYYLNARSLL